MTENNQFPTEDRDQQILRRLTNIEYKVDSLDQTTAFALRADAERHFEVVKKIFGQGKRRVQVYLAANGERSVNEIAELLGMRQPDVSKALRYLQQEGLLEVHEREGRRTYWGKKQVDRTLRISMFLMEKSGFDKDGLPTE